jgi:hypothetical protein
MIVLDTHVTDAIAFKIKIFCDQFEIKQECIDASFSI